MSTELNLEEIESRCEKATPGPWIASVGPNVEGDETSCAVAASRPHERGKGFVLFESIYDVSKDRARRADADFIAHARTDVPALCREIRALRNWQNRAADAIRAYRNYTTLAENWNNEEETFRLLSELPRKPDGD